MVWLIWLLLAVSTAAGAEDAGPAQWRSAMDAFAAQDQAQPPPQHAVLFIGSSSINFWHSLAEDFPGVPVINRGFGGSAIEDSTYYADRIVTPYHPRLIVMYAGDNDIYEGHSAQQVADDFKAFVARVRKDLPAVPVVYISIKPSVARWSLWPAMREANGLIRDWAATQHGVRFVDIAPPMLDAEGKPRAELFRDDGLHMKPAGYALWIEALRPVLAAYGFKVAQPASAAP
jgi:lysophospholipase L1-like esterase